MPRNALAALVLLLASLPAMAAPVTLRWTNPTQWTDGTPLPAASIRDAVIACAPSATAPFDLVAVVDGSLARGVIDIPADRWCAVRVYAEVSPGVLRESDYSARVIRSPKRPGVAAPLPDESAVPPNCARGQTCPAP